MFYVGVLTYNYDKKFWIQKLKSNKKFKFVHPMYSYYNKSFFY